MGSELTRKNIDSYRRYTAKIVAQAGQDGRDETMAAAIGASSLDEFHRSGQMEADLLAQEGLNPEHYLIDVGCGSGRLATKLRDSHTGRYLGTEISPDLLDFARAAVNRPDWVFEAVEGLQIPERDDSAHMVCFFSVLTHLRHEESFLYLEEARRVLLPGGHIVFSFLDFSQPNHRVVFEGTVSALRNSDDIAVNQFISVDAITVWADMLSMDVSGVHPGSTNYISLTQSAHYRKDESTGTLGQSVCVLTKRPDGPTRRG